ncbi:MAG: hypothetical protein BRD29_02285 [Bacteroidetes bacterium QH_2_67_10]|nr:MAG: hypothetical protein BRD29_02285 [Bacteroidetes bacterium QH_2_67_10]
MYGLLTRCLRVSSYDRAQEDEAAWLGGCLQIPRTAMLRAVSRGMDNETIARHYTASTQMVQFRARSPVAHRANRL